MVRVRVGGHRGGPRSAPGGHATLTGHALGVHLTGAETLAGLVPGRAPGRGLERGRRTFVTLESGATAARWPADGDGAQRLVERRQPNGRLFLAIDHHRTHGFRIEAPGHGTHVVSPDGRAWAADSAPGPAWAWYELAFAQVLPTVAALHGLEPLHASAVAIGGRVYGLIGTAGVGKSSTAAHLVGGGAEFVTDDVLAIEELAGRVVAHPGPRVARLHAQELDTMASAARARLGPGWGEREGKHHLSPVGASGPQPLAALVFLARVPEGTGVTIAQARDSVPLLLAAAFAPHVATRGRLERQLAVCAAAHRDAAIWRARVPPRCGAADVAEALRRHVADRPSLGT